MRTTFFHAIPFPITFALRHYLDDTVTPGRFIIAAYFLTLLCTPWPPYSWSLTCTDHTAATDQIFLL